MIDLICRMDIFYSKDDGFDLIAVNSSSAAIHAISSGKIVPSSARAAEGLTYALIANLSFANTIKPIMEIGALVSGLHQRSAVNLDNKRVRREQSMHNGKRTSYTKQTHQPIIKLSRKKWFRSDSTDQQLRSRRLTLTKSHPF
jgi:hypothetical protein